MAIDSFRKRESAFLMGEVILPDASIDSEDRKTLLSQYGGIVGTVRSIALNLYVEMSKTLMNQDVDGLAIKRAHSSNAFLDRSRDVSLNIT